MRIRFLERMARGEEREQPWWRVGKDSFLSLPRGRLVNGQRPEGL